MNTRKSTLISTEMWRVATNMKGQNTARVCPQSTAGLDNMSFITPVNI